MKKILLMISVMIFMIGTSYGATVYEGNYAIRIESGELASYVATFEITIDENGHVSGSMNGISVSGTVDSEGNLAFTDNIVFMNFTGTISETGEIAGVYSGIFSGTFSGYRNAGNDVDDDGDGYSEDQGDCWDGNAAINPGAVEINCDDVDQNCDGNKDTDEADCDSDGYKVIEGDCNDYAGNINPGTAEVCSDGVDNDCDTDIDCTDSTCLANQECVALAAYVGDYLIRFESGDLAIPFSIFQMTIDQNGSISGFIPEYQMSISGTVYSDGNLIFTISGINFTGTISEAGKITGTFSGISSGSFSGFRNTGNDVDDDGDGYTEDQGDCYDGDAAINPGAVEINCDNEDQNCDGNKDTVDADCDGDGYSVLEGDCNDYGSDINPDVAEVCSDGIDNNCDTNIDCFDSSCLSNQECVALAGYEGDYTIRFESGEFVTLYDTIEITIDKNGNVRGPMILTGMPVSGSVDSEGNLNFLDDLIIYQGFISESGKITGTYSGMYSGSFSGYRNAGNDIDDDGDGYTEDQGDCYDGNADVNPGLTEICRDGLDNDCDHEIDCADISCIADEECMALAGYEGVYIVRIESGDLLSLIELVEITIDQNGNVSGAIPMYQIWLSGTVDSEGNLNVTESGLNFTGTISETGKITGTYSGMYSGTFSGYRNAGNDVDDDGDGYSENQGDCDDGDADFSPAAVEINCDDQDQNCDGRKDTVDADCDGDEYSVAEGDCNDYDGNLNPGITEICNDGIDNNCNTEIDCVDSSCVADQTCLAIAAYEGNYTIWIESGDLLPYIATIEITIDQYGNVSGSVPGVEFQMSGSVDSEGNVYFTDGVISYTGTISESGDIAGTYSGMFSGAFSGYRNNGIGIVPGDFNNDGDVDLADAILVLQVMLMIPSADVHIEADVNGDQKIGMEDVVYILQKAADR